MQKALVHITGATVPDCFCRLVGIDAGSIVVRSDRQIPESTPITIAFDHIRLSGNVATCQPTDDDWVISVALASSKRRLETRVPVGEPSVIGIVESDGTTVVHGTVVDQSASGLRIEIDRPLAAGTRVCAETESMMVFGEVRYCRRTSDRRFVAGVLVADVAPDVKSESAFSLMLNNLRWKLASTIRPVPVTSGR